MNQAQEAIMFLALVFGLPLAAWAHLSLQREMRELEVRCRDCAHCRAKKQEQDDLERERLAEVDRRYRR